MILVTTAGNVGSAAALELLRSGNPVRILVRDQAKHQSLADAGAELVMGDLNDDASVASAVEGVSSVVLVSLAIPQQELRVVEKSINAGVGFIVKASSKASADSPIARRRGQTEIEAGIAELGIPHVLLRSNAYTQNFLALAPVIASTNSFASSAGDGRVGLVDARDVGAAAAAIARDPSAHSGRTYWLSGPALLSYGDVAEILTRVLGRPISFSTRSREADAAAMIGAGVPEAIAQQNAQAFSLIADGDSEWLSEDITHILGRPARSFEEFATDFAAVFAPTLG